MFAVRTSAFQVAFRLYHIQQVRHRRQFCTQLMAKRPGMDFHQANDLYNLVSSLQPNATLTEKEREAITFWNIVRIMAIVFVVLVCVSLLTGQLLNHNAVDFIRGISYSNPK